MTISNLMKLKCLFGIHEGWVDITNFGSSNDNEYNVACIRCGKILGRSNAQKIFSSEAIQEIMEPVEMTKLDEIEHKINEAKAILYLSSKKE